MKSYDQRVLHAALPTLLELLKQINPAAPLQEDKDNSYPPGTLGKFYDIETRAIKFLYEMKYNAKYAMLTVNMPLKVASCINAILVELCVVVQEFNKAWDLPVIVPNEEEPARPSSGMRNG